MLFLAALEGSAVAVGSCSCCMSSLQSITHCGVHWSLVALFYNWSDSPCLCCDLPVCAL